jgi:hypothetical protein
MDSATRFSISGFVEIFTALGAPLVAIVDTTGVVDTRGNMPPVSLTPAANLLPVWLTMVANLQRWACKSANSYGQLAIENPQISEICESKNFKFAYFF